TVCANGRPQVGNLHNPIPFLLKACPVAIGRALKFMTHQIGLHAIRGFISTEKNAFIRRHKTS
ncbi:MAG: hypothetical protein V6Z86_09495, partial [Hyphomicrobiales bacterium]